MFIDRLISTIFCFGLVIFLTGCSTKKQKYKITLRYSSWESAQSMKWHNEYFTMFNKQYPEIKVVLDNVVGEHSAKLLTEIAGGSPPDLTLISEACPDFISKGAFIPLDEYIKKDKLDMKDFPESLLVPFTYENKVYALPADWNSIVLFYNKDIFDREKMKYPDETWTWSDLLDAAQKMTVKKQNRIVQYGLLPGNWLETWYILVRLKHAQVYDKYKNKWLINTKESIESLQFLKDLIHKYKVSPTLQSTKDEPLFELGKIAMSIEGAYRVGWYGKIKRFNWDIAPLPKLNNERKTIIFVAGLAILKGSKHYDASWEFIKFRTSPSILNLHCSRTFLLPARLSLLDRKMFLNPAINSQGVNYDVVIDSIKYGETYPFVKGFREVYRILQEELSAALMNIKTAETACIRAQEKISRSSKF